MNTDTQDFLEALSFAASEDSHIHDINVAKYHPAIVAAVDQFVGAFRTVCVDLGLDPDWVGGRSFGANVYFTLSGHGCGFQDDNGPWGDVFAAVLREFAGSRYRFEELDSLLWRGPRRANLAHFSVHKDYLKEYLDKYFGVPDISKLPAISKYLSIAFCPAKRDLRAVTGTFTPPPYWNGEAWTFLPFSLKRYEWCIDEIEASAEVAG
jgi:hypothetical protein